MKTFLLCLLALVAVVGTTNAAETKSDRLMLVMDVGSSGTRMYAFTYQIPEKPKNASQIIKAIMPVAQSKWVLRVTPGAATLASNPSALASNLEPLFKFAREICKNNSFVPAETPVFLAATAGFRILTETTRSTLFTALKTVVQNSGFLYDSGNIRVISGTEEGLFAFLSANILAGTISADSSLPVTASNTVGALDCGGASSQIAFQPEVTLLNDAFTYEFRQQTVRVFTHSWLKHGQDQFHILLLNRIVRDITPVDSGATPVTSGCFNTGFTYTHTYKGKQYTISGNSDINACIPLIDDLTKPSDDCPYDKCSIKDTWAPAIPSSMTFYASSSWFYVTKSLLVPERATLNQIWNATLKACSYTWQTLPANGHITPERMCYQGAWFVGMLHRSHGFPLDTTNIVFTNTINGIDVNWPLGLAFYEVNKMEFPEEQIITPPPTPGNGNGGSCGSNGNSNNGVVNINFEGMFNGMILNRN